MFQAGIKIFGVFAEDHHVDFDVLKRVFTPGSERTGRTLANRSRRLRRATLTLV